MTTSGREESNPLKSKPRGTIVIVIVAAIVAVAIAGYVYMTTVVTQNDDVGPPARIDVVGEVNPGADRIPVSLLFEDVVTGETENVSFEGTHYEIDLPNGNYDWHITVIWHGVTNGQCDGGNLAYQRMDIATITHNVSCQN